MPLYVNESSTLTVLTRFYDQANELAAPQSIRYLIKDVSNDRTIKDWTSVSPAPSIEIEVAGPDNEIYEDTPRNRRFEKRVLTVQVNAGLAAQYADEFEYWVRNLAGISND